MVPVPSAGRLFITQTSASTTIFRTEHAYDGDFAAGDWTFYLSFVPELSPLVHMVRYWRTNHRSAVRNPLPAGTLLIWHDHLQWRMPELRLRDEHLFLELGGLGRAGRHPEMPR